LTFDIIWMRRGEYHPALFSQVKRIDKCQFIA
jgi:hypothetical protein